MPKIPGVNHLDAVRALEKAGFRIVRQGKHIVMGNGQRILTIPRPTNHEPRPTNNEPRTTNRRCHASHIAQAQATGCPVQDQRIVESEEVKPGFILDYNEKNEIVGFEILHVASRVLAANLRQLQFEIA